MLHSCVKETIFSFVNLFPFVGFESLWDLEHVNNLMHDNHYDIILPSTYHQLSLHPFSKVVDASMAMMVDVLPIKSITHPLKGQGNDGALYIGPFRWQALHHFAYKKQSTIMVEQ